MTTCHRLFGLMLGLLTFAVAPTLAAPADLTNWPEGSTPEEIGKRVAENFLARTGHMLTPQDGTIHYSEACTWYGALTYAQLVGAKDLQSRLVKRYEPLRDPANAKIIPNREHVDWAVFSIVPLEIFLQTKDPEYLALGLPRAKNQWATPGEDHLAKMKPEDRAALDDGLKQGLSWHTRFWIDDMYMISALQTQAHRATGDMIYLERAAHEMVPYLEKLQQPDGLFLHGFKGPFRWGRGNGWMAAGMTELLRALPTSNPNHARILDGYRKMMAALLRHQDASGMWHQLVDDPDAWPETSGTGMFTFAFITGVKHGWLDEKTYGPAARKAWLALVSYLDEQGNVREVCKGMGQRPTAQGYIDAARATGDFHGQAPLLWCASALLR